MPLQKSKLTEVLTDLGGEGGVGREAGEEGAK